MSDTYTQTDYQVQLDIEGNGAQLLASIDMPARLGITDALALQFVQTLKTFPWPTGATVNVQVNKATQTTEVFQTRLDTDPPAFT